MERLYKRKIEEMQKEHAHETVPKTERLYQKYANKDE